MGGGHSHAGGLHVHGHSIVHELPAETKIVATILFVFAVVATPRTAVWAFALHAFVVGAVLRTSGLQLRTVMRRLALETPFVAFAVFLPFVGRGERIHVLGLSLSVAGLWAAWNILVKGSLGVLAAVVLASTTTVRDLLVGLQTLRMPSVLVQITSFMVRYGEVVTDEMRRMKVARESRGHDPRWIWQARAVAASAGALFIRSYERGERVYLAMQSRGYTGTMPASDAAPAQARQWRTSLAVPFAAALVCLAAWTVAK